MAKIGAVEPAEHDAIRSEQAGGLDLVGVRPARGSVGLGMAGLTGAPDRHADGDRDGDKAARGSDQRAFQENVGRVGVIEVPPPEESRRWIDRQPDEIEPWRAELRLKPEPPRRPLRRAPGRGQHDREDGEDLAPENLGRGHGASRRISSATGNSRTRPRSIAIDLGSQESVAMRKNTDASKCASRLTGRVLASGQNSSRRRHRRGRCRRRACRDCVPAMATRARAGSRARHRSWRSGRRTSIRRWR